MFHQGIQGIPYYLGIRSLADVATREDRVCVLNIMGGESRQVTPTSHAFSGGNVVFGTSPGRAGQVLKTQRRRHPGLQQRPRGAGRRAQPSTPASSTCRPRGCATAWPSWSGSTRI